MVQPIYIKRRVTGVPGGPGTLAPGELAYNSAGNELFVGDGTSTVQNLVSPNRQVELAGAQTINGAKTIAVGNLKVTGGAADNVIKTDGAGNLSFVAAPPPAIATPQDMIDGTRNDAFATPLNTAALTGASIATLITTAKTLVPAINELKAAVDLLGMGASFVGSFDAAAGTILWTTGTGTGNTLPAAGPDNNGWYLIADAAGAVPPGGATPGNYDIGDWLISNGTVWTHLAFGGLSAVTAGSVPVNPAVQGATDVQGALVALEANAVLREGDTMTGPLILSGPPTDMLGACTKEYADAIDRDLDDIKMETVVTDGISITGDGWATAPLTIALVDGGIY